jgi:hypothetical protein
MKYDKDIDYRLVIESVAEELQNSDKYIVDDVEVSGTEYDNDLKLTAKLTVGDYVFDLKARYIIDKPDIDIQVTISYNSRTDYDLTESDVRDIHDATVYVKKLMKL